MTVAVAAIAALITLGPIAVGLWAGWRLGAAQMIGLLAPYIAAAGTAALGFVLAWREPFGLVTPVVSGAVVGILVRVVRPRPGVGAIGAIGRRRTTGVGAGVGAGLGFGVGCAAAAVLWIAVLIASAGGNADGAESETWAGWRELATSAHRGLIRHLPFVGPASDELVALVQILDASPAARRRLASGSEWRELAELQAMRAALDDLDVLAEIESVRAGNPLALYRLQRHPRIIDLFDEPAVRKIVERLRPTALAKRLKLQRATR